VDHARRSGAGTAEQIVDQLGAYRDVGAGRAYLRLLDSSDVEQIQLLGESVLPGLAR
jgi:hypothetical protein